MARSVELNPCGTIFLPRMRRHDGNPDHDCPLPGQQTCGGLQSFQRILEMLEGVMKHDHVPFPLACLEGSLEDPHPTRIFDSRLHIQVDALELLEPSPAQVQEKSPGSTSNVEYSRARAESGE